MLAALSDAAYNTVQSLHSDSAVAFALFLHHLPDFTTQLAPSQLLAAMQVMPRKTRADADRHPATRCSPSVALHLTSLSGVRAEESEIDSLQKRTS